MARGGSLEGKFITLVERIRPIPPPQTQGPFKVALRYPKNPNVSLIEGAVASFYESVVGEFVNIYAPQEDSPVSEREVRHRFDRAIQDALGPRGQGQPRRTAAFGKRLKNEARRLLGGLGEPPVGWQVYLPLHAPSVTKATSFGHVECLPGDSATPARLRDQPPTVASAFKVDLVARLHVHAVDAAAART